MRNIGFIGLGDMGMAMAKNLLKAGFAVTGYDLREQRLGELQAAGGSPATSPAEVGKSGDTVFVMVLNGDQVLQVIGGADGLTATLRPGATVIVCATVHKAEMEQAARLLAGYEIVLIDAPVSGGRAGAEAGTLTLMAAGPRSAFEQQQEVLQAVGKRIFHVGERPGMGQTVKASLQALMGSMFAASYESLVLAAKAGVDPEVFRQVVAGTGAGCGVFEGSAQAIIARRFNDTGSQITTMHKDLGICLAAGREHGAALFMAATAQQLFQAGITRFPGEDNQCVAKVLEQIAGVEVGKS